LIYGEILVAYILEPVFLPVMFNQHIFVVIPGSTDQCAADQDADKNAYDRTLQY